MNRLTQMPLYRRVRSRLIHEVNRVGGWSGYEFKPTPAANWQLWLERVPNAYRERLFSSLTIDLVVDVGANTGQYGEWIRNAGYTGSIVSFEPQSQCVADLQRLSANDPKWKVVHAAVGAEAGTLMLNVAGNSVSSSLLPMTNAHLNAAPTSGYVRQESVDVVSLDGFFASSPADLKKNVWLKVDTQGYEWPVILGAEKTLENVIAIELELSFVPMYDGQKLFDEIVPALRERGFVPHAFHEAMSDPNSKEVYQVDGLFVRRPATT